MKNQMIDRQASERIELENYAQELEDKLNAAKKQLDALSGSSSESETEE